MSETEDVGENQTAKVDGLKELRDLAGLNLSQLAALIGRTTAYVSMLERGERGASHETLFRLSRALGCSIDQLTTKKGEYPKPLADFLKTMAPEDIADPEITALLLIRIPGRRITARAYNNLLDAIRNSEKIQ